MKEESESHLLNDEYGVIYLRVIYCFIRAVDDLGSAVEVRSVEEDELPPVRQVDLGCFGQLCYETSILEVLTISLWGVAVILFFGVNSTSGGSEAFQVLSCKLHAGVRS